MLDLFQLHSWSPSPYYQPLALLGEDAARVTAPPLATGWTESALREWTLRQPADTPMPAQGWKIHVSSRPGSLEQTLGVVDAACVSHGTAFKYLATEAAVHAYNSKYVPRGMSGKFVTCYPTTVETLVSVVDTLDRGLRGLGGARVLSDIAVGDGPVHVRYGGFQRTLVLDPRGHAMPAIEGPDGDWRPDVRAPGRAIPDWVEVPQELVARRRASASINALPYTITGALHFSNAGGVYEAVLPDGTPVVVKEYRPEAGLDMLGRDAVTRSHCEEWALRTLAGVEGVPVLLSVDELDGHRFLAMSKAVGDIAWRWQGTHNPLIDGAATDAVYDVFRERALALFERIRSVVEAVHERGVVHGDLHPGNVLVGPDDSVTLIDFEVAGPLADGTYRKPMGALGFAPVPGAPAASVDAFALEAMRLWVFLPLNAVWAHDPSRVEALVHEVVQRFRVRPAAFAETSATLGPGPRTSTLVGLERGSTTWNPRDPGASAAVWCGVDASRAAAAPGRIYAGDPRSFQHHPASFVHGAGGVLWAMRQSQVVPAEGVLEEFLKSIDREPPIEAGFAHGAAGMAVVADAYGLGDLAAMLMERALTSSRRLEATDVAHGGAGIGLAALLLDPGAHSRPEVRRLAARAALSPSVPGTGLMNGLSGSALFLAELAWLTGDVDHLRAAEQLWQHDLERGEWRDNATFQVRERTRTLAYLERGSAGLLVVGRRLRDVAAELDAQLCGPDERLWEGMRHACEAEFVVEPHLMMGRAGLLAAYAYDLGTRGEDTALDPVVQRHLDRLRWHAVGNDHCVHFPGAGGFRFACDWGAGSAGIANVIDVVHGRAPRFHPFVPQMSRPTGQISTSARDRKEVTAP